MVNESGYRVLPVDFITGITNACYSPEVMKVMTYEEVRDALSTGQLKSKLWLVEELDRLLDNHAEIVNIVIAGGWHGFLARLILTASRHTMWLEQVVSFDLDPRCRQVASTINHSLHAGSLPLFYAETCDALTFDYSRFGERTVVINTSSEHMPPSWINNVAPGQMVIAQSNDNRGYAGHDFCVDSEEELAASLQLSRVIWKGALKTPMYQRFMVIGVK